MAISHFAGHGGERIVFAHANGYPPGSYQSLLQALGEHCEVSAYEHTPLRLPSPPRANLRWRHFADDYRLHLQDQQSDFWLMGHSLGATVSMLASSPRLASCKGLILLDPIFLPPPPSTCDRIVAAAEQAKNADGGQSAPPPGLVFKPRRGF